MSNYKSKIDHNLHNKQMFKNRVFFHLRITKHQQLLNKNIKEERTEKNYSCILCQGRFVLHVEIEQNKVKEPN